MKVSLIVGVLLVAVLCASLGSAHDQEALYNEVRLTAQVERDIANNEMIVVLASEHEGSKATAVVENINSDMQWALELVKQYPNVKSHTQAYQVYQMRKNQLIIGWQASQQIEVKSTDTETLTELVGKLQARLQVRQMLFVPTAKTRVKHEDELIAEAMQAFIKRIEIVKTYMPHDNYRIINVAIDTSKGDHYVSKMPGHGMGGTTQSMNVNNVNNAPAVKAGSSRLIVIAYGSVEFF